MKHQIWCSIFRQKQLGKFQHSRDFMAQTEKHILDGIGIFGQQSPVGCYLFWKTPFVQAAGYSVRNLETLANQNGMPQETSCRKLWQKKSIFDGCSWYKHGTNHSFFQMVVCYDIGRWWHGRGVAVLHHCWKKMFQLAPENGAGYSKICCSRG